MKYWRTMLIASALGVCGLAVWANDKTPKQLPMPATQPAVPLPAPVADAAKDDQFLPIPKPADPSPEPIKVLELASEPKPPSLPIAPPVVPPPVLPTKADMPSLDLDVPAPPKKPTAPPMDLAPLPGANAPAAPPLNDPPPLPKAALDLPPSGSKSQPSPVGALDRGNEPMVPLPIYNRKPDPIMPVATNPAPSTQPPVAAAAPVAYKLHVRMGGNLGPRFEVRDGDSLLLKVYCDHIDMQGSQAGSKAIPGLTATGNVRVAGSGVSGTCDSLTIAAAKGEVTLKGHVKLTCYRGNASGEISGEAMNFQLKGATETPSKIHASGVTNINTGSR